MIQQYEVVKDMPMLKDDYQKTEKINGVIYNMSPAANFRHGIVNGNIHGKVREGVAGARGHR